MSFSAVFVQVTLLNKILNLDGLNNVTTDGKSHIPLRNIKRMSLCGVHVISITNLLLMNQ